MVRHFFKHILVQLLILPVAERYKSLVYTVCFKITILLLLQLKRT